jgi:predicted HTH domain antitoxin
MTNEEDCNMLHMTIDMPEEALAALRTGPKEFARELRIAAAVKWYELQRVSQERAATIAGLSRSEFLTALGQFGVTPFQYTAEEVRQEAESS